MSGQALRACTRTLAALLVCTFPDVMKLGRAVLKASARGAFTATRLGAVVGRVVKAMTRIALEKRKEQLWLD